MPPRSPAIAGAAPSRSRMRGRHAYPASTAPGSRNTRSNRRAHLRPSSAARCASARERREQFSPTTALRQPRSSGLSAGSTDPNAIASTSWRVASTSAPDLRVPWRRRAPPAAAAPPAPFVPARAASAPSSGTPDSSARAVRSELEQFVAALAQHAGWQRRHGFQRLDRDRLARGDRVQRLVRKDPAARLVRFDRAPFAPLRQCTRRGLLRRPQPVQAFEASPGLGRIGAVQRRVLAGRNFVGHPVGATPGDERRLQLGVQRAAGASRRPRRRPAARASAAGATSRCASVPCRSNAPSCRATSSA